MGQCYSDLRNSSESLKVFTRCLDIREKLLAPGDHELEHTRMIKGTILWKLGMYKETIAHLKPALESLKKQAGSDLYQHALPMECLGDALLKEGNLDESQRYLTEALVITEKNYGRDSIHALQAIECLGDVFMLKGKKKSASERFGQVLRIKDNLSCWQDDSETLSLLRKYCCALMGYNNYQEVVRISPRLLALWDRRRNRDEEAYLRDTICYARCLAALGQLDAAKAQLEVALPILEMLPESQTHLIALRTMASIYASQGEYFRACAYAKKEVPIIMRLFGESSQDMKDHEAFLGSLVRSSLFPELAEGMTWL